MPLNLLILIILGIVSALFVWVLLRGKKKEETFAEKMIQNLGERLSAMEKTVESSLRESRQTLQQSTHAAYQQIERFTSNITSLAKGVEEMRERVGKVVTFQDMFKAPKTKGRWGEAQLNHILGQYYDRDLWQEQFTFQNGEAVDAVLFLPNKLKLPIDSKLRFENFEKMVSVEDELEKEMHKKDFIHDVKEEIDKISTKYVQPQEDTTEVAIMFIPAESVYYEIVNNLKNEDLTDYGWRKRVVLTSPNTLYITLTAFSYLYSQDQLRKETANIIKRLEQIKIDAEKLRKDFQIVGKHLSNASGSYQDFDNRLRLLTDRVDNVIKIGKSEQKQIESVNK